MKMFITLLGLVLILEGLPYVASPEAMQRWLQQLTAMRPEALRTMGILAMAVGFFLCFLALKSGVLG